jgi:anti-sigma regulatory factor (Ser/Thr protein kinase)
MCAVTPPAQIVLPTTTRAPATARAFLRGAGCSTHHARVLDEAELLVSELATNAVLHGTPPISVRVECDGSRGLRVSVTDGSEEAPLPREAGPEDGSGRGMLLVDVISDHWGVHASPGQGKAVWFRLRQ